MPDSNPFDYLGEGVEYLDQHPADNTAASERFRRISVFLVALIVGAGLLVQLRRRA